MAAQRAECNASFIDVSCGFDDLYASKFSSRSRSSYRRKERKLAKEGKVEFDIAQTPLERLELFDIFRRQKSLQFKAQGFKDVFADPSLARFYRALAGKEDEFQVFDYAYVKVDGDVIATFNGMSFQDSFYFLTASMTLDKVKQWSPSFLLMKEQIKYHCQRNTFFLI